MASKKHLSPALGLCLIAGAAFIGLSLWSYQPGDLEESASSAFILNYGGRTGAGIALYSQLLIGWGAYLAALLILGEGIAHLIPRREPPASFSLRFIYELLIVLSFAPLLTLLQGYLPPRLLGEQLQEMGLGGLWGGMVSESLMRWLGLIGTRLVLVTVLVVSACLLTEMKPLFFLGRMGKSFGSFLGALFRIRREKSSASPPRPVRAEEQPAESKTLRREQRRLEFRQRQLAREKAEIEKERKSLREEKKLKPKEKKEKKEKKPSRWARRKKLKPPKTPSPRPAPARKPARRVHPAPPPPSPAGPYQLPPLDLLLAPPPFKDREIKDSQGVNSRILESTLLDFGVEAKVVGVEKGPAITRYALEPAPGVKVRKVQALENDIALTMKATSVRILAPIPGKGAIGVEMPNSTTTLVYLREMIESPPFKKKSLILPLAIGKDISGSPVVADLTDLPHLLIAGATGSGKTVCINSIIMSLLYARTPDELRLILVDPKKVEMTYFSKLPHLICPVVTEAGKVVMALNWLIQEMERRYDLLARVPVRNIKSYNNRPRSQEKAEEGEEALPATLPYIVLLIDELADLMLMAPREVESGIARLAHLSRAVGIHMILATQRPSVDVVTGVIKANFPGRISFKVAAKVDSRTVLDAGGADKLLGDGDLLFLPPATSRLVRAQGTLCQDTEIQTVVNYVQSQRQPQFNQAIFQKTAAPTVKGEASEDSMLESSIEVIRQTGQASVSMLQRKLKIGYSRAARIMDSIEEKGLVGPYRGTKPREILMETYADEARSREEE